MKQNGYVLIELIISIALLSISLFTIVNLVFNISKTHTRVLNSREIFENISLAQNFIVDQLRRADKIKIITDQDYSLNLIQTYIFQNQVYKSNHTFSFKNNSINFGGVSNTGKSYNNQLATNIQNAIFKFDPESNLLHITFKTQTYFQDYSYLSFVLYLKNKIILFNN